MSESETSAGAGVPLPDTSLPDDISTMFLRARALDAPPRLGLAGAIDRFEVLKVIGEGGMGVVFLANDPQSGGRVAIKMIRPELVRDPHLVRRFLTEARHMQKLKHEGILRVLEVSDRATGPYYVMEFKPNGSLAALLSSRQPLERTLVLHVARQVARALAHAHAQGLIHRDVKPHNILLDQDGTAQLGDFGLVRTVYNDSLVEPGKEGSIGTLAYMSPAVARGEAEDTRCDIYSFGAVLYEMLTGSPAYEGPSREATRDAILARPPVPILKRNPAADPELSAIAQGCMARELRDRYATMNDVVRDLDLVAAKVQPLGPRATSSGSIAGRRVLIGACAVALLATLAGTWSFVTRERGIQAANVAATVGSRGTDSSGIVPLDGELDLKQILNEWPETFSDTLMDESCLSRAHLTRGLLAYENAFKVVPGVGLETRGFRNTIAWWNTLVGSRYAVSFEFRPEMQSNYILLLLNGDGYGQRQFGAIQFHESKKKLYILNPNGSETTHIDLPPLSATRWYKLVAARDGEALRVWLNGELIIDCRAAVPPDDALHRFVGLGSGTPWFGITEQANQYRNFAIRMPREERDRLAGVPIERQFDLAPTVAPLPTGELVFEQDFRAAGAAGRQVADLENVFVFRPATKPLLGPAGLELNDWTIVHFRQPIPADTITEMELDLPDAPASPAQVRFLLGEHIEPIESALHFKGLSVDFPNHSCLDSVAWFEETPGKAGTYREAISAPSRCTRGRSYKIRMEVVGEAVRLFVNGALSIESAIPPEFRALGELHLNIYANDRAKVIQSVRVWRPQ